MSANNTREQTAPASETLRRDIETFYRAEISLLQKHRYRQWLELMDEGIIYRVPVTTSTAEGLVALDDALGYYDEDIELLKARVAKLESKQSWVEQPTSRLRYFIQLLDLVQQADGTILACSNLLLYQHRWNLDQNFTGERTDILKPVPGGFKLRSRLVVLDRQAFTDQGLSVFF
jgi:3-phenylpropionate/cinnamic acid dioxygenase small subunit